MEREPSQAYHPVVVLFDDADKEACVVFGEELAIDYQDMVAVPDCSNIVPPLSSRAGFQAYRPPPFVAGRGRRSRPPPPLNGLRHAPSIPCRQMPLTRRRIVD